MHGTAGLDTQKKDLGSEKMMRNMGDIGDIC